MSRPTFGVDADGHLVIAGAMSRCIALHLDVEGARATFAHMKPVVLPWDHFRRHAAAPGALADSWDVRAFVAGRAPAGLAVRVSGVLAVAAHDLSVATRGGLWRRCNRWLHRSGDGSLMLPIVADASFASCGRQRATVGALMEVLASRPDLRARLADAHAMRQLADALSTRCLGPSFDRTGLSRDGVDITYALHQAGFVHRYGRPLPGDDIAPLDEVTARTMAQLSTNPYRRNKTADAAAVERYVRRNYTDVARWPFEALSS